jgi:hypothetical protein
MISHRGKALNKMKDLLASLFTGNQKLKTENSI